MLVRYHIEITREAIGAEVSPRALDVILRANARQDSLRYQFGHDHFHFDSNCFEASHAYIEEQRSLVRSNLEHNDAESAWRAFGRMIHAAQDFYAHSDYIPRWLSRFNGAPPPPSEVDPILPEIFHSADLRSGKLYYPFEVLAFIPILWKFVLPILPPDSHAHMNHDGPHTSTCFSHVFHAAVKRTRLEFEQTTIHLSRDLRSLFTDSVKTDHQEHAS